MLESSVRQSCVYSGTIRHRRYGPVFREFRYRLFMMYLDLEELPGLFDAHWLWSARRPALAWFRRADYLGDPAVTLTEAVRSEAERLTGHRPAGPIRLLTHLRYFGYVINPVSFYYCFSEDAERVECVLAEVTNTPWNERHVYAVGSGPGDDVTSKAHALRKAFHVSPFMDMDYDYTWHFGRPGERLKVHMVNEKLGSKVFDATLTLERSEIRSGSLARALVTHPLMTARVAAGIYGQAARLWLRGVPFHVHPDRRTA